MSSINSRYTHAGAYKEREMAATCTGERDGDTSSFYSSEEEEEEGVMSLTERDTRSLLRTENDPRYLTHLPVPSSTGTGLYPQLHHVAPSHVAAVPAPPLPGAAAAVSNAGQHNTQYGSVSGSLPSNGRPKPKGKRYRLPFLILLVFDCGLVIFLSIIAYDSKVRRERGRVRVRERGRGRGRESERERGRGSERE